MIYNMHVKIILAFYPLFFQKKKKSNINNPVDLKKYINWLEKSIDDEYLDYYKYSEFKNIQQLGLEVFFVLTGKTLILF